MLIHVCCADCFLKIYQTLKHGENVSLFFYNPNLHPREEYYARLRALKRVIAKLETEDNKKIKLIIPDYKPQEYFEKLNLKKDENLAEDLLKIPPKNRRCPICWRLRLEALFHYAKENGYKKVSSTLFSSSYQNIEKIKQIASALSQKYDIEFYLPDQKKLDKYQLTKGFYKQNYCGCVFSLVEKVREKYKF